MAKNLGKIIIPHDISVWPHELRSATALSSAGYTVKFLPVKNAEHSKSPDIIMGNKKWEIKAPRTNKLSAIERNLKRAYHQSTNIVFDSYRMKKLSDELIQRELIKQFRLTKKVHHMLFINRKRQVIDIRTMS